MRHAADPCPTPQRCVAIRLTGWILIPALVLPGTGLAQAPNDSCLITTVALERLTPKAKAEPANASHSVLRPCAGLVQGTRTTVLYSVGDGSQRELAVSTGERIEQRLAAALGPGRKLVDVWPRRSVLAALRGVLTGERGTLTGTSGFEGDGKTLALTGSLLMLEPTALPLAVYGLDPAQPLQLRQGSRSTAFSPQHGQALLRFDGYRAGLARIEQGQRQFSVRLVEPGSEPELVSALQAVQREASDADTRRLQRALLLQEAEYPTNAVAEAMKGLTP